MAIRRGFISLLVLVISLSLVAALNLRSNETFWHQSFHQTEETKLHARSTTATDPAIIPFGNQQDGYGQNNLRNAYGYVLQKSRSQSSELILYPYSFNVDAVAPADINKSSSNIGTEFDQGGVLAFGSTKDGLPLGGDAKAAFFDYLKLSTDIDINAAQALYDTNIAVLTVTDTSSDLITYEVPILCTLLHQWAGKYSDCLSYSGFAALTPAVNDPSFFVTLAPSDIQASALETSPGIRQFGILILPDFSGADLQVVIDQLSVGLPNALQQIKSFADNGGHIIASGKGAVLLESIGLLAAGYFDQSKTLQATGNEVVTTGCGASSDFGLATICFSVLADANGDLPLGLVSPYLISAAGSVDSTVSWLVSADTDENGNMLIYDTTSGLSVGAPSGVLPLIGEISLPFSKVFINLGSGTVLSKYYPWFINSLFLLNSKPIFFDWSVNPPIIPALEQVILEATYDFTNLFSSDLTSFEFRVWKPTGTTFISIPTGCALNVPTGSVIIPAVANIDTTQTILCSPTVAAYQAQTVAISLRIDDVLVTQQKVNVWVFYPTISYSFGGAETYLEPGATTVDALFAAFISADYNPDPSSIYPIAGAGSYMDNVLTAENKAETQANNVVHIAIVPLISPAFDMGDQAAIATALRFDFKYYQATTNHQSADYIYPFTSTSQYDFLDYQLLGSRGTTLAADWDSPVKIYKEIRNTTAFPYIPGGASTNLGNIGNIGYQTNIDNVEIVTRQQYFANSDQFYEAATQRLLAFSDTTTVNGSAVIFGGSFPAGTENPNAPGTEKKRWLFSRNDVYFYDFSAFGGVEYPMPEGVANRSAVFTVDRYATSSSCPGSQVANPGCWGNACTDGLQETEYYNALLSCSQKLKYFYDDIETLSGGQVKKIHYLVPIVDPDVTSYDDVELFEVIGGEAIYNPYSEIKFIHAHNAPFILDPATAPEGGYLQINLPATHTFGVPNPQDFSYISYSADQVAITETTFNSGGNFIKTTFRRGNDPNEKFGKPSQMEVNFENLTSTADFTATYQLYALTYDFTQPAPYTRYDLIASGNYNFTYNPFLSLPAVKMSMSVKRTPQPEYPTVDSYIFPYENFEPYARYGIYLQEIQKHRTVWTSPEIHLQRDPGLVTKNGGLSLVTHIGISSIPFREYVTTGSRQLIPAAPETGRVEWDDIWGRRWAEPVRSLFLDVPPIPPPLRNFIMTTTFELLDKTGARKSFWNSRDPIDVRVQLKLLNNYPKYFEITACGNNTVTEASEYGVKRRLFSTDLPWPSSINPGSPAYTNPTTYADVGYEAFYGLCFTEAGATVLSGQTLNGADVANILAAELCSQASYQASGAACQGIAAGATKVISRRPDNSTNTWNYSPLTATNYPTNYIKSNMWDLTHYDYDDNAFDKAYKYHMDNNLPNIDTGLQKPENVISFPLFKGAGYSMTYDKTYQNTRYQGVYPPGWWSDNLQNRDDTLLAGQSKSQDVSVNHPDLTLAHGWTPITGLNFVSGSNTKAISALKNIYTCLFNRWRPNYDPSSEKNTYPTNVYVNNIVPILPDLDRYDSRLSNYACGSEYYTPENISQFDATLETNSARDYLYFAANLRGGAKESWNIVYNLDPITSNDNKYEDPQLVVQDGGSFTYWNPANGPNSFLIVDNPVSISQAIRTDVEATGSGSPSQTSTLDSTAYLLVHVYDQPEINREWTLSTFNNHLGFGDASVSVFVGGVQGTTSVVQPGQNTTVEIAFYNNAGFDWNLKWGAIDSLDLGNYAISGNDLLSGATHAVKQPTAYNFFSISTPDEPSLINYLTITPSSSALGRAPEFFDFENINVATIRDGFKGLYYITVNIHSNIPDALRGRVHRLAVTLDPTYFDNLPGLNDPTGPNFHNYTLAVPDILIGVPYGSNAGSNAGKVFYTSGRSTAVKVTHDAPFAQLYSVTDARYISVTDGAQIANGLLNAGTTFAAAVTKVPYTLANGNIIYDLSTIASTIPLAVDPASFQPDVAEFYILVELNTAFIPYGTHVLTNTLTVDFLDWEAIPRQWTGPFPYTIFTVGPTLAGSATAQLISPSTYAPLADQTLGTGQAGTVLTQVTFTNTGSGFAYGLTLIVVIPPGINVVTASIPDSIGWEITTDVNGNTILKLTTGSVLAPGDPLTIPLVLQVPPQPTTGSVTLIKGLQAQFYDNQSPLPTDLPTLQVIDFQLAINVGTPTTSDALLTGFLSTKQEATLHIETNAVGPNGNVFVWYKRTRYTPPTSRKFMGKRAALQPLNSFAFIQTTTDAGLVVPLQNCSESTDFVVFVADALALNIALVESQVVTLAPPCPPSTGSGANSGGTTGSTGSSGSTTGSGSAASTTSSGGNGGGNGKCKRRVHDEDFDDDAGEHKLDGKGGQEDVWKLKIGKHVDITLQDFATAFCEDKLVLIDSGIKGWKDINWKVDSHGNAVIDLDNGSTITILGASKKDLKKLISFDNSHSDGSSLASSLLSTTLLTGLCLYFARRFL